MNSYIDETTKEDFIEDTAIREAIDNIYDMLADLPKNKRLAFFEQISKPKDHSRLGRNRLVVGQLLEEDFVRLGIRYIAIMDNIDTKDGLSDFLPVQDWFNEMHAKNTSKKVRAVFQNKGMSGKPLTTVIPYGYKKNEAEPAQWLIDEEAAEIVRRIFHCNIFQNGTDRNL